MKYLVDSSIWIDYFDPHTVSVRSILESDAELYIVNLTIIELQSKLLRKGINPKSFVDGVKNVSNVLSVDSFEEEIGNCHARIRAKIPNFGLVDASMVVLADVHGLTILTKDTHFSSFKRVKLIS